MIASVLLMLKISTLGATVARPTLKFFDSLKSSCVMRSTNAALYGMSATLSAVGVVGDPMKVDGRITVRAGHGAGQLAGYSVVPRVMVMLRVVVVLVADGLWLLWNAALSCTPQGSGYDPASFRFLLNGMPFSRSLQKRIEFGLSGEVQFTSSCRSMATPPNTCAPRPGRKRNSKL